MVLPEAPTIFGFAEGANYIFNNNNPNRTAALPTRVGEGGCLTKYFFTPIIGQACIILMVLSIKIGNVKKPMLQHPLTKTEHYFLK